MALSTSKCFNEENFRLQPKNWTDSDENEPSTKENEPPPKRKRLSLRKKRSDDEPRWTFLSPEEETALSDKCIQKNTATSTKWAVANFACWRKRCNETFTLEPERQVPDDLLLGLDSAALCKWLSLYVAEARKQDGHYFRRRVCTCYFQAYCVTCVQRILLVRIFSTLISWSLLVCTTPWTTSLESFVCRVFLSRVNVLKPLAKRK